jgi:hypothetical protein
MPLTAVPGGTSQIYLLVNGSHAGTALALDDAIPA